MKKLTEKQKMFIIYIFVVLFIIGVFLGTFLGLSRKNREEKEMRKQQTKEKNKNCKRNYINKKRQADKEEYAKMQAQQNKDAKFLSAPKKMNDITFAKWNRSAYTYDSDSSDLLLKDDIITGYNAPKRVSNVVNPNSIKSSV